MWSKETDFARYRRLRNANELFKDYVFNNEDCTFTYTISKPTEKEVNALPSSKYMIAVDPYENNTSNSFGINLQTDWSKLDSIRGIAKKQDNITKPINSILDFMIQEELSRKPTEMKESNEGIFGKEFYYNKSKHGDNFYQILKKLPVKNEYHDWEDYYLYKQCGTGLEFLKPIEMFNKEFKKVRIDD